MSTNLIKLTHWLTRPLAEIDQNPSKFLQGPIRSLVADAAKAIAPVVSDQIKEQIIAAKTTAALAGFHDGLAKGTLSIEGKDPLYQESYRLARSGGKEAQVRKLVREAVESSPDDWGVPLVRKTLMLAWDKAEPSQIWGRLQENAKLKGWRIGISYSIYDLMLEVLIPSVLLKIAQNPKFIDANKLNLGPLIYQAVRRTTDELPPEIEMVIPGGQVNWFTERYGPIQDP